ncbi:hypothetical protein BD414DRAFT_419826 [Trametes punicea]|nr:hypothetical protein BD414DRAFT_419826 [Trametes punicea]
MSPALSSPAPARPWWSRSKPSKEQLRANRSLSTISDDSEKYSASPASSKHKDGLSSLKFNTLASAIGLKSKKLPALTIQDPPSPLAPSLHYDPQSRPGTGNSTPSTSDHAPFYTNRPPAKSVSTVRSSEYDFDAASDPHTTSEPRTPSDHPRDRTSYQTSVMTFSEIDPFASGGIVVQHLPQEPNRLSVYSDSSMLDPHHQKKADIPHNRRSYGSSSSNSHGNSSDGQALSPLSASSLGRSPTASRSAYDLSQPIDTYPSGGSSTLGSQTQRTRRTKTPSGSNSSNSTVTPDGIYSRLNEPGGPGMLRKRSSPSLSRSRGMTVGAAVIRDSRPDVPRNVTRSPDITLSSIPPLQVRSKPSGSASPSSTSTPSPSPVTFTRHRNDSATPSVESPVEPSPTRPLVLVRKASSSRVKLPPLHKAPPMSDLPPPPPPPSRSPYHNYDLSPLEFRTSSSSSLSLNFAPSIDGFHDVDNGDAFSQLMHNAYDLGPFEVREPELKGKRKGHRNTYILDGDLNPSASAEASLPSPLSKFPPVPAFIHGDLAASKAGKLLKKMSSQQNLAQRNSAASFASSASHDDSSIHGQSSGKSARKQRSFHHPRVPLPPLPSLRGSSTRPSASAETLPAPASPMIEPRRSSVTSPRKRLFSGSSSRRSTSSHGPTSPSTEDDGRSILSLDIDSRPGTESRPDQITLSFGSGGAPLSLMTRNACISPSSLWEDTSSPSGGDGNSKRTSQSEYVPQYIMSPAEQLKLAEKLAGEESSVRDQPEPEDEPEQKPKPKLDLQPGDFGFAFRAGKNQNQNQRHGASAPRTRSRSNSVLSHASTGTLAFGSGNGGSGSSGNGGGGEAPSVSRGASVLSSSKSASGWHASAHMATSPRNASLTESARGGPARSSSMFARNTNRPPAKSVRPSTAQASLTPPTSPTTFAAPATHSPEMHSTSLPPPPRRKPPRRDLNEPELASKRVSIVPINPLSPPPVRQRPRRQQSSDTSSEMNSRPPSAFDRQKAMQRRSLMKKPSFLDIEDEVDNSAENEAGGSDDEASPQSPSMDSSFLDMDRKDSFDTVRSADSAYCVF